MSYDERDNDALRLKENIKIYEDAKRKGVPAIMSASELCDIAEHYYNNGRGNDAVEVLRFAMEVYPGVAAPLVLMARIALLEQHDSDLAMHYIDLVEDTSDLDYMYILAEITILQESAEEADRYLRHCLDNVVDEDDEPDFVLDVAALFMDYGYADLAQEWLDRSDEDDLDDYKELVGRIAMSRGEYKKSAEIFEKILEDDPYSADVWNNLASAQFMQNKVEEAIESSEYSIAINPNDDKALVNKGHGLQQLGKHEEALEYYRRFTALYPNDESGYMLQGGALTALSRYEEALDMYKTAEKKARGNATARYEAYVEIAFTLSALGRTDEAIAYVDKARRLKVSDRAELLLLRAHIYLSNDDIEKAKKNYRKAISESDDEMKTLLRVSVSVLDCGYFKMAYKFLSVYIHSMKDEITDGYSYMALCCKHLNEHEMFLKYLKLAADINPGEARTVLGELFPRGVQPQDYYEYAKHNDI